MENNQLSKSTQMPYVRQELSLQRFGEVFESGVTVQQAVRNDEMGLLERLTKRTIEFLVIHSEGDNFGLIARVFAQDIIETRPDWKVDEIDLFFKFIRQRRDLTGPIFGNKITLPKLADMVLIYENYRSEQREIWMKEKYKDYEQLQLSDGNVDVKLQISRVLSVLTKEKPKDTQTPCPEINSEFEALIKEFDMLYEKSGRCDIGKRFIEYRGKMVDVDGFLINKINEI